MVTLGGGNYQWELPLIKFIVISLFAFSISSFLFSQEYKIQNFIIPSSAVDAESESFRTRGGLAEWTSDISTGQSYTVDAGFWGSMVIKLLDVEDELPLPEEFQVAPAYPNPFNPSTTIDFTIPEISDITIAIYDILGREIFTYNRSDLDVGHYSIKWNGTFNSGEGVPTGVYIVHIRNSAKTFTQKITLLK